MSKLSQFNIFFKYADKYIGYNTYNQELITIEPLLYELITSADEVDELKNIHSEFYYFLMEKGFIVDEKINEVKKVKKLMNLIDYNDSSYELTINSTMNCNFKCWYCYENHIIKSKLSDSVKKSIVNHAKIILENKSIKEFHLSWFGGEPLLEYRSAVVPLTEKLLEISSNRDIYFTSAYTTNGLLIKEDMLPFFKKTNVNNFQITLDGHRERHNKVRYISKSKGSYDEIIKNIFLLISNDLHVTVRINYSEETLPELTRIADDFYKIPNEYLNNMEFSFNQVWQVSKDLESEMKDIRQYFHDLGFSVMSKYSIDSVRHSCYADKKNHATINYNGDVFKCTARDFISSNREGVLKSNGEIIWNEKYNKRMNIKLKNKPCHTCAILPVCGGGCTQNSLEMLEKNDEYCLFGFDEERKIDFVKNKVISSFN